MASSKKTDPETETSAGTTYLADDVSNEPTGAVEQQGPVTYLADHVPDDAPQIMGKRVAAPEAGSGPASGSQASTK